VADALRRGGVAPAVVSDALLVLSELVGNAIRHARTEFTVSATLRDRVLRLEVADRDTRPPSLLGLDSGSTSGRGLHIVAGIAGDWGWQTAASADGEAGKLVWAEILSPDTAGAAGAADQD